MPAVCVSCEDSPATTTCGSSTHDCFVCAGCRLILAGPMTPAEGARDAAAEQPSGTKSATSPHIVPSAGTT